MKLTFNKNITRAFLGSVLVATCTACSFFNTDAVPNPNAPDLSTVMSNASRTQIQQLGVGVLASMRNGYSTYCQVSGTLGREIYVMTSSDTRWLKALLGTNGTLDNTAFYNSYYNSYFSTRKRAAIFEQAALNTNLLNDQEKSGIQGFANTVKAFAMLHALNMQGKNGIRIDLDNPKQPGPFVSYEEALAEIKRLLDLGATQLDSTAAGSGFAFAFTSGFMSDPTRSQSSAQSFDTPATFLLFNRALAARVAMYQQDWQGMLNALGKSFLNLNGPLSTGPVFTYAPAPDVLNPFYQVFDNNNPVTSHPSFVADAAPTDARLMKVHKRIAPYTLANLTGSYDVAVAANNSSPASIIRNEELILMYAEANIQLNNLDEGVKAINIIRSQAGGLPPYSGSMDQASLINEVLLQRRYSLFYEGHRWLDARRYNRLNELPLDLPTHKMFDAMPRPLNEINWDNWEQQNP